MGLQKQTNNIINNKSQTKQDIAKKLTFRSLESFWSAKTVLVNGAVTYILDPDPTNVLNDAPM